MKTALSCVTVLGALLGAPLASASGLYVGDRGVRPLGRGGAFVAGADDLGALWYNPAGLVEAGASVLVDASWVSLATDVTRRVQVSDGASTSWVSAQSPVRGSSAFMPVPTLAGAWAFGENKRLVVAAGVLTPQLTQMSYPLTLADGSPSPARYSLVTMEGSVLAIPGVSLAWRPVDWLQVGAGFNVLTGSFVTRTVFNTSPPDRLISAPEDPSYDALSELKAPRVLAPGASFGLIALPHERVRVGVSGQLGYSLDARATVKVRLPGAALFDGARQEGEAARLRLRLPAILRAGVEVRPMDALRVELGYARELWSAHQSIDVLPEDVRIVGVPGVAAPFSVPTMSIPRHFRDSQSLRLGGEYRLQPTRGLVLEVRGGVSYEQSAIPTAYLTPLTVDADKVAGSLGLGARVGERLRLDAVFSRDFGAAREVSTSEAAVPRVNPMAGDGPSQGINAGTYRARTFVLGLGASYAL